MISTLGASLDPTEQTPKPLSLSTDLLPQEAHTAQSELQPVLSSVMQRTHAIMQQQLFLQLEVQTQKNKNSALSEFEFLPKGMQATIDNVLGAVKNRIHKFGDPNEHTQLVDQINKKVDQGIDNSKHILKDQGILNSQTNNLVDSTHDLIQQGISRFSSDVMSNRELAFVETSSRIEHNARIQLKTAEGDVINIELHKSQSEVNTLMSLNEENIQLLSDDHKFASLTTLGLSISGNLNSNEKQALVKLLEGVHELANSFFNEGIQQTFEKLNELQFDSNQLNSMSMDFSKSESHRVTAAYQSIGNMPIENNTIAADSTNSNSKPNELPTLDQATSPILPDESSDNNSVIPSPLASIQDIADFMGKIRQLFSAFQDAQFIANPHNTFLDLFAGFQKSMGYGNDQESENALQRITKIAMNSHDQNVDHKEDE